MVEKRLEYLMTRYLKGQITASEQYELARWTDAVDDIKLMEILRGIWEKYREHDDIPVWQADLLLSKILKAPEHPAIAETGEGHSDTGEEMESGEDPESEEEGEIPQVISINPIRRHGRIWMRYAAALIIFAGLAIFYYFNRSGADTPQLATQLHEQPGEILPGREGAVLVLSDGSQIVLDSLYDKTVTENGNTKIAVKKGELSYVSGHPDRQVAYNKLITAKGREYRLVLEDGTRVWLNAGSSIRFPVRFADSTREVLVTGEVYFEVAPDKSKPFYVKVGWGDREEAMRIAVLGTHFNVNAYDNEQYIKTTLFEGSVVLESEAARGRLRPGEQAVFRKSFAIHQDFDPGEVLAWKNGYFHFDDSDIQTVMKALERWYDIEVEYEGPLPKDHFGGKIPREVNVSEVLEVLRRSNVNFSIEGRKIIVRQ